MASERQLRFGILCDSHEQQCWQPQRWQQRCLEQLLAVPGTQPEVLLVRRVPAPGQPRGLFRLLSKVAADSPAASGTLTPLLSSLRVVELVTDEPLGDTSGSAEACDAAIRASSLDFILSFSAAPAHGLIKLATYGVWTYEFGDWQHFRGAPLGFWEVYRGARVSGAMLARLTADPDAVVPLRRGYLSTQAFSYHANRDQLLARFTHWPAQVCREILHADGACLESAPLRGVSRVNTAPCNAGVARFAVRLLGYVLSRGVRSWVQQDHWNIGIVNQPIEDFVTAGRERQPIQWLPPTGTGRFIADPFGWMRDGRLTIFCEYLDYRDGVGTIAAFQPDALTPRDYRGLPGLPVEIGPTPRVHLSYPAVFEHDGRLLCIPETSGAREVALYELQRFPDRWVKVATLLADVSIVDATPFRHDGRWWLAGASDYGGVAKVGSELHLWYADELTGPWVAHPSNPVKVDICSARPAGPVFVANGALYRPAQDSSATYGARVVIQRILTLTTAAFREEPVASVEPDPNGPYPDGLHTLVGVGRITLVDGKRLALAPAEFRRILSRMFLRRLRKLVYRGASAPRPSNSERHNCA